MNVKIDHVAILIGALLSLSVVGCGLLTPIEEVQVESTERQACRVEEQECQAGGEDELDQQANREEEMAYSSEYIASPSLHPTKGDVFLLRSSNLTVLQVLRESKVNLLAVDPFSGFVVGVQTRRSYVDEEKLAPGYYMYVGRYRYTTQDERVKTVRVFQELSEKGGLDDGK